MTPEQFPGPHINILSVTTGPFCFKPGPQIEVGLPSASFH